MQYGYMNLWCHKNSFTLQPSKFMVHFLYFFLCGLSHPCFKVFSILLQILQPCPSSRPVSAASAIEISSYWIKLLLVSLLYQLYLKCHFKMQVIALSSSQVRLKGNYQPQSLISKNLPKNVWCIKYRVIHAKLNIIYNTSLFYT